MTTKPQIISEYEIERDKFAEIDDDNSLMHTVPSFKRGANWGSTESPIMKLMEETLKLFLPESEHIDRSLERAIIDRAADKTTYNLGGEYIAEPVKKALTALDSLRKWVGK